MKKTFSNKILDWTLVGIALLFSVLAVWDLKNGFEFFSSYLLKIVIALISTTTFLSLLISKINSERFSRIFVLVVLIIPAVLIANQFITDLVFYGATRTDLLQNPLLFINPMVGIIIFQLTIKYSRQEKSEQIKDYGILIIGVGIFTICYVLTRTIEPNFSSYLNDYPIWKTIVKSVIGIATLIIGTRIKNEKMKFKKGLIWTIILMFIFGLI